MRSRPRIRRAVIASTLLAAIAAPGLADSRPSGNGPEALAGPPSVAPFSIKGDVRRLYPGAARTVRVRLTNPNPFVIRVVSLEISKVRPDPRHPACGPSRYVRTDPWTGSVKVPAGSAVTIRAVRVSLLPTAPNTCQGARLPVTFAGSAVGP